ncbi:hypothetical protein D3C78_1657490 [compost metagenome]
MTRLHLPAPGEPCGAAIRVITLLADHFAVLIKLQGAGAQMVIQVVAVLITGAVLRFPMQHPHTAAPSLHVDHLQHFAGAAVGAQFQIG